MRTRDEIKQDYDRDYDFKRFMEMHDQQLAIYMLFSHFDDCLMQLNKKLEDINSLLAQSSINPTD